MLIVYSPILVTDTIIISPFEILLLKKQPSSFRKHELSILISCLR